MNYKYKTESSDPELFKHLGLLKKFDSLNLIAQQEGKAQGDLILTEPSGALGQNDYIYYVQLAGFQLELSIPPRIYDDLLANIEDVTHDVDDETDQATTELYLKSVNFMSLVASKLQDKTASPALMGLKTAMTPEKALNDLSGLENVPARICHVNEGLFADMDANPVDLTEAEFLYQPVKSTGNNKKTPYYLVAVSSDGVKVAARFNDGVFGIRIKVTWFGDTSRQIAENLVSDFGFTDNKGGHYTVHYKDIDAKQAQRVLYAILSEFDPASLVLGLPNVLDFQN
ncbi:hypothetical protein [Vibrio phage 29Fa.3]|nr:hypothetical protein [Vibrio phage 29Fa.3]